MGKKSGDSWMKLYFRLVREFYYEQRKVQIISNQLRRYRVVRTRFQKDIQREAKHLQDYMENIDLIREELDRLERTKHTLTPKKRQQLTALQKKMPVHSLEERVRIMELSELSACWPCGQPALEKQMAKMKADKREIKRIHNKTMEAIEDIRSLETIRKYLRKDNCTRIKIKPYVNRGNWLEPRTAADTQADVKATIALDHLVKKKGKGKGKKGRHLTRNVLEVTPRRILLKIPELMPDMYHYLDNRGKNNLLSKN
ncbi:uncharacterized protein [Drosophila pseudoobscura]|uniref:Uncharacterized protein n=1 Tax=Drosophila pseudoobscura pseudoobscura TaxID=46245 RepID=A0A6I8UQU9_DROPS|nr:uncharacterized protein LOC4802331 [Drosophila pseudoobscura]